MVTVPVMSMLPPAATPRSPARFQTPVNVVVPPSVVAVRLPLMVVVPAPVISM